MHTKLAAPLIALILAAPPAWAGPDRPAAGDDATFRPTVLVGRGQNRGSGTVIASVDGETLVLTPAHVVAPDDPDAGKADDRLWVELHRYNLGLEGRRAVDDGRWPRRVAAEVAASDRAADVAVIRVRGMVALPYVARLALDPADLPAPGEVVTSVGIDRAEKLSSWETRLRGLVLMDMEREAGGGSRPFVVTERPPEVGRSGGGLYRADGRLVGVCVGRARFVKRSPGPQGVFAAGPAVAALLLADGDLVASVARSEAALGRDPEVVPTRHPGPPEGAPRSPKPR